MRDLIAAEVAKALKTRITRAATEKLDEAIALSSEQAAEIDRIAAEEAAELLVSLTGEQAPSANPDGNEQQESAWVFATVFDWVEEYLAVQYWRETEGLDSEQRWCDQWWAHPEALFRLTALWEMWENERAAPGGMLRWWMTADHHMDRLFAETGPFIHCRPRSHSSPSGIRCLPCAEPTDDVAIRARAGQT